MKIFFTLWPLISTKSHLSGIPIPPVLAPPKLSPRLEASSKAAKIINSLGLIPLLFCKIPFIRSNKPPLTFRNFAQSFESLRAFGMLFAVLCLNLFGTLPASAWGPVGHETVAYIAQDNLAAAAKAKIATLLDQGDDLASISNWADQVRQFGRPETAPWHFIDLPIRKDLTLKDEQEYCPNNDCVLNQLQIFQGILGDASKPKSKRLEALKFIVHFMGDLHQPLHCADDNDRGGNEKLVRFKDPGKPGHGAKIKLHALWDHLIEPKTGEDPRQLATELEGKITAGEKKAWVGGNEKNWAFESYMIAKTKVYKGMDPGTQDYTDNPLPSEYFDKMRPIVDQQLEKAGIRLAFVLNEILK